MVGQPSGSQRRLVGQPGVVLERFLGPVAVVVRQLNAFGEIIFRYEHEMRTRPEHYRLRH